MKPRDVYTLNKTSEFLTPLLGISKEVFYAVPKNNFGNRVFNTRYINAYLRDTFIDDYREGHIFILHRNYQDSKYSQFDANIRNYPNFVKSYEICNSKFGVKIFKIPDTYLKDYNYIKNGKYSKISDNTLELIMENTYGDDKTAIKVRQIVKKSPILKEAIENRLTVTLKKEEELWGKFTQEDILLSQALRRCIGEYKMKPNEKF